MNAVAPAPAVASEVLRHERIGAVALLTLNRPAARNALSHALLAKLIDAFAAIGGDAAIRAVVVAAEGPAFCAGHDLKEMTARRADADGGRAFFEEVWERCSEMMQMIVRLPQPVIACVKGVATAAGCQLVASCDLAVASAAATFATPGVNIGLFCSSPMVALSRNVARKHAMEMLLTGDMVVGRRGVAHRPRQPRGGGRRGARRGDGAGAADRIEVGGCDPAGKRGILRAAGNGAAGCLRSCFPGHGGKHVERGRKGRHCCVPGQAAAAMGTAVTPPADQRSIPRSPFRIEEDPMLTRTRLRHRPRGFGNDPVTRPKPKRNGKPAPTTPQIHCADEIPDRERVYACLVQKVAVLSPACKKIISDSIAPPPRRPRGR